MQRHGLTLIELMLAMVLAGLVATATIRLATATGEQQRAVLQTTELQAELRRATGVAAQVMAEQPFLLPLRGDTSGLEFLQSLPESSFRVLEVSGTGLIVRFTNPAYNPQRLRRILVVDSGGNGYVYTISRITALDAATGTYQLEGSAACAPTGQGLRGVGASLARLGSGAALNTFAGGGQLAANRLYFQQEDRTPEVLMSNGAPAIRYIYRAADGQILHQQTASLYTQSGAARFELAGLALDFQARLGAGAREARRELASDILLQADAGLGLRRLGCNPLATPPPQQAGDWQINIIGLDPGVPAHVTVSGPGGFNRVLTASTTLRGLIQGRYNVSAQSVVHPVLPFVRYRPTTPAEGSSLGVDVGGGNRPVTEVRYARLPGNLRVRVEGLPAGVSATLNAAGTFTSYTFSLATGEHLLTMTAGRYTLTWQPEVPDPQNRGTWHPEPPTQTVDVPSDGEVQAAVRYVLMAFPSQLEINVRLAGGGTPLANPRICIQPSNTINQIDPRAAVYQCAWE
jgi:prepilin-type N-terminal cleavage/methylation domain-containing protein